MTAAPSSRRWVQVRRDGEWVDLLSASDVDAKEHVERIAFQLGAENVRLKPTGEEKCGKPGTFFKHLPCVLRPGHEGQCSSVPPVGSIYGKPGNAS